jgi:hypothetical protein
VLAIVAGCYTHPDMIESWNAATHRMWWRGVIELRGMAVGDFGELALITQESLRLRYAQSPSAALRGASIEGLDLEDVGDTSREQSVGDVARALGVDHKTVRAWCKRHSAPPGHYRRSERHGRQA